MDVRVRISRAWFHSDSQLPTNIATFFDTSTITSNSPLRWAEVRGSVGATLGSQIFRFGRATRDKMQSERVDQESLSCGGVTPDVASFSRSLLNLN